MKPRELKVARIGNSRGVRLPAAILERYRIGDSVVMEELAEGILLRPRRAAPPKLTWEETARAMAAEPDDWSVWNATLADGLDDLVRDREPAKRVAEPRAKSRVRTTKRAPKQ
jgi:antitoxin MazE